MTVASSGGSSAVAALSAVNNLTCCYAPGQQLLIESGLLLRIYDMLQVRHNGPARGCFLL